MIGKGFSSGRKGIRLKSMQGLPMSHWSCPGSKILIHCPFRHSVWETISNWGQLLCPRHWSSPSPLIAIQFPKRQILWVGSGFFLLAKIAARVSAAAPLKRTKPKSLLLFLGEDSPSAMKKNNQLYYLNIAITQLSTSFSNI